MTDTLLSLATAGFSDPVLFAEPDTEIDDAFWHLVRQRNSARLGPWRNWWQGLRCLTKVRASADAFVMFQDDARAARNLRPWLETQLWPKNAGIVALYTPSVHHREDRRGWHRLEDGHQKAFGALGYVMPPDVAKAIAGDERLARRRTKIDFWVAKWCLDKGLDYWMHTPSLLEHTGETSAIGGRGEPGIIACRQCGAFLEAAPTVTDPS